MSRAPRSNIRQEIMKPRAGLLVLLTANVSCLHLPGLPTALTQTTARTALQVVRVAQRKALARRQEALRKVHDVDRGGAAEQRGTGSIGLLTHATALPLVETLPPEVGDSWWLTLMCRCATVLVHVLIYTTQGTAF